MKPSKEFLKSLAVISPDLSVKWQPEIERWVVDYKNSLGQVFTVLEVKNSDGSFRPLDDRTLEVLRLADMSTKVHDIKYLLTEQFRKTKEYKERIKKQNLERALDRANEISQKRMNDALDNLDKGIWSPKDLPRKIFSLPLVTGDLLRKLGRPHLAAKAVSINP